MGLLYLEFNSPSSALGFEAIGLTMSEIGAKIERK
jgi:hypothetical protein